MTGDEVIDITGGDRVTLICAECGMQRPLPRDWRRLMREDPATPDSWDGILRCKGGVKSHDPAPMHGFEGMEHGPPMAGRGHHWRYACACGHRGEWTADKDGAWQEAASHLMTAVEKALELPPREGGGRG